MLEIAINNKENKEVFKFVSQGEIHNVFEDEVMSFTLFESFCDFLSLNYHRLITKLNGISLEQYKSNHTYTIYNKEGNGVYPVTQEIANKLFSLFNSHIYFKNYDFIIKYVLYGDKVIKDLFSKVNLMREYVVQLDNKVELYDRRVFESFVAEIINMKMPSHSKLIVDNFGLDEEIFNRKVIDGIHDMDDLLQKASEIAFSKTGNYTMLFNTHFLSIEEVCLIFLSEMIKVKYKAKRCRKCQRFFAIPKANVSQFCNKISPHDSNKTCKQYNKYCKEKALCNKDENSIEYQLRKVYKAMYKRKKDAKNIAENSESGKKEHLLECAEEKFKKFNNEKRDIIKKFENKEISEQDVLNWVKDVYRNKLKFNETKNR